MKERKNNVNTLLWLVVTLSAMVVFQTTIKRIDVLRSCYLTGSFLFSFIN